MTDASCPLIHPHKNNIFSQTKLQIKLKKILEICCDYSEDLDMLNDQNKILVCNAF